MMSVSIADDDWSQLRKQVCSGIVPPDVLWHSILVSDSHGQDFPSLLSDYDANGRLGIVWMFVSTFAPVNHSYPGYVISAILGKSNGFLLLTSLLHGFIEKSPPMRFSIAMKTFFVNEGRPNTVIDSVSGACPTPVAICPHTAARLHSQY